MKLRSTPAEEAMASLMTEAQTEGRLPPSQTTAASSERLAA